MELHDITVSNVSNAVVSGGKLTFNSMRSGLTLGVRPSPFTHDTTDGSGPLYVGDLPPWSPYEPLQPISPTIPYVTLPYWEPHGSYAHLSLPPLEPWQVVTLHDRVTLVLDVPGIRPSDLDVQIEGAVVQVSGKRADNGHRVFHTWTLDSSYDPATATAEVDLGTLRLVVKKFATKQVHRVKITVK